MLSTKKKRTASKVLEVRHLTDTTVVVRFERHGLEFEPGQYIRVGIEGDAEIRDYSIYSGQHSWRRVSASGRQWHELSQSSVEPVVAS